MSMSIFQLLMLLFVWKHVWQPLSTNRFFSAHTYYASNRSSCMYEDVDYPFEDDL